MKPRFKVRRTIKNNAGQRLILFGIKFGYWPCLKALFIEILLGWWALDFWFGKPGYKDIIAS